MRVFDALEFEEDIHEWQMKTAEEVLEWARDLEPLEPPSSDPVRVTHHAHCLAVDRATAERIAKALALLDKLESRSADDLVKALSLLDTLRAHIDHDAMMQLREEALAWCEEHAIDAGAIQEVFGGLVEDG